MKRLLHIILFSAISTTGKVQVTTPALIANFGIDADLRSNYYDGFLSAGNDDWFSSGDAGPGTFIIDTTGASYIRNLYITNPASRMTPFFRGMRYPQFSIVNGMMLIDGIFIRDHHGDDSTVFASGSNKNGMSPASWSCPVSQGIPDKNDILDMFMHVRRAGPNGTDPLWLFGGLSLDNTTGNRYFDFEMYQTDIVYNRPTLSFTGYGPDFGHTSWEFDASGNVTKAGDIIFTAEYSSSSLSNIEARIWINRNSLMLTPVAFNWGGDFDGDNAGATHGYASILPKTAGDFYTGLQCSNNTWGGPFSIVLQNNSLATNYSARQFMEFSVNLSKLGLDPLVNMGDPCQMPFRRILVKSRASTSFTAELKDFVGPFSFFRAPVLDAVADVPYFCGSSEIRTLAVANPLVTSLYIWDTPDGNILGSNIGPEIRATQPGMYIVSQELMDSCGSTWARDTVTVLMNTACVILNTKVLSFTAETRGNDAALEWQIANNSDALYFELEKSTDNVHFVTINKQYSQSGPSTATYRFLDKDLKGAAVFYRVKIVERNGVNKYSKIVVVSLDMQNKAGIKILPNPVGINYSVLVTADRQQEGLLIVSDIQGRVLERNRISIVKGSSVVSLTNPASRQPGMYTVRVLIGEDVYSSKMVFVR